MAEPNEPDGAEGVEYQSVAEGQLLCGRGRVMSNQGEAGGTSEPGGAVRMIVPRGAKEGRSQGGGDWSTNRGGETDSVSGGGARGSS